VFIDNIFRFTQAGSEVWRARPDAVGVGYQPTLAHGDGRAAGADQPPPRKAPSRSGAGPIYVPADEPHRPGTGDRVLAPRRHRRLSRQIFELGIIPRWIRSRRRRASSTCSTSGSAITTWRRGSNGSCSGTRIFRTSSRSWGWTSCPKKTSSWWRRRAPGAALLSSRSRGHPVHRPRGQIRSSSRTPSARSSGWWAGEFDHSRAAFYMVAGIDEALAGKTPGRELSDARHRRFARASGFDGAATR